MLNDLQDFRVQFGRDEQAGQRVPTLHEIVRKCCAVSATLIFHQTDVGTPPRSLEGIVRTLGVVDPD